MHLFLIFGDFFRVEIFCLWNLFAGRRDLKNFRKKTSEDNKTGYENEIKSIILMMTNRILIQNNK